MIHRELGVDSVKEATRGSVSALIVGPPDKVEEMLDSMWAGPGAAAVRDVSVETVTPVPEVSSFEITG